MFIKIKNTIHPPLKPTLVWDGSCGFCKFWITNWQKFTGTKITYIPYQEGAEHFPDIPLQAFKKASHLIEPDGNVFSGPASAYRSYFIANKYTFLDTWYAKNGLFTKVSDKLYHQISNNRSTAFKLTHLFFGYNPEQLYHLWLIPILLFVALLVLFVSKF